MKDYLKLIGYADRETALIQWEERKRPIVIENYVPKIFRKEIASSQDFIFEDDARVEQNYFLCGNGETEKTILALKLMIAFWKYQCTAFASIKYMPDEKIGKIQNKFFFTELEFISLYEDSRHYKSSVSKYDLLTFFSKVPILVLDGMYSVEYDKDMSNFLKGIINERINDERTTIITTTPNPTVLAEMNLIDASTKYRFIKYFKTLALNEKRR